MRITFADITNDTIFHYQTRPIRKYCFFIIIITLPFVLINDSKDIIAMTLKTIRLSEPISCEVTPILIMLFNIIGLIGFLFHRKYRLQQNQTQFENLINEKIFPDTFEYSELVGLTLNEINNVLLNRTELTETIFRRPVSYSSSCNDKPSAKKSKVTIKSSQSEGAGDSWNDEIHIYDGEESSGQPNFQQSGTSELDLHINGLTDDVDTDLTIDALNKNSDTKTKNVLKKRFIKTPKYCRKILCNTDSSADERRKKDSIHNTSSPGYKIGGKYTIKKYMKKGVVTTSV